ncbi:hypothetical protein RIF29_38356 [Crotalaria pallida]|uniref:Protein DETOXIFICATION n=1 Tax=Crotalaria pallida TaxID=3830 RepID=A0AAN9HNP6_CROPI
MDPLAKEILKIAFPAAMAVAADPIASLIDTAFIGHLGPVELAAAGAAIALFNQALKLSVAPLVSITTSFVAEEDTTEKINTIAAEKQLTENLKAKSIEVTTSNDDLPQDITIENSETPTEAFAANGKTSEFMATSFVPENDVRDGTPKNKTINGDAGRKKKHLASASTALLFGAMLGLVQATTLIIAAKPLLGLSYASSCSKVLEIEILRFSCSPSFLGHARNLSRLQRYSNSFICHQVQQFHMLPPSKSYFAVSNQCLSSCNFNLRYDDLFRIVAVTFCVTLAASLATRLGPIKMAAFQTCLQVWLTASLLADGLAVAGQAILACSFAEKDYDKVTAASARTVQFGFVLGVVLSLFVGFGLYFGAGIFSKSILVVNLIRIVVPFVAATQPINSLAFVFDGVLSGASDFAYSGYSLANHDVSRWEQEQDLGASSEAAHCVDDMAKKI